jgi:hypothetical protein
MHRGKVKGETFHSDLELKSLSKFPTCEGSDKLNILVLRTIHIRIPQTWEGWINAEGT